MYTVTYPNIKLMVTTSAPMQVELSHVTYPFLLNCRIICFNVCER